MSRRRPKGPAEFPPPDLAYVRDDGTQQWAFQGKPLYLFAGDTRPGEINGDNQGGVWHALRSAPKKATRNDSSDSSAGYSYSY